jgi:Holliday junction resolvasome RuvABC endonuclease subunit
MNLLAFDLGLKWGWAYGNAECAIFGNDRLGKEQREITLGVQLSKLICELPEFPDAILYEHAFHQPGYALDAWYPLVGILREVAQANELPIIKVSAKTIKKHTTGNGNCGKDAMIAAMKGKGYDVTIDDEADALALLLYAIDTNLLEVGE